MDVSGGSAGRRGRRNSRRTGKSSFKNVHMVELRRVKVCACDRMWKGEIKARDIQNMRVVFL